MSVRVVFVVFLSFTLLFAGCGSPKTPATPVTTLQTYVKAIKQKDTATMKLLLSDATLQMHEMEAQALGVTLDEIVKRETLFAEHQKVVKFRNEKIDGELATLEVQNSMGIWETVPFVKENGEWKIDKKGFAQQLIEQNEKSNQELDNLINQGRQQ